MRGGVNGYASPYFLFHVVDYSLFLLFKSSKDSFLLRFIYLLELVAGLTYLIDVFASEVEHGVDNWKDIFIFFCCKR